MTEVEEQNELFSGNCFRTAATASTPVGEMTPRMCIPLVAVAGENRRRKDASLGVNAALGMPDTVVCSPLTTGATPKSANEPHRATDVSVAKKPNALLHTLIDMPKSNSNVGRDLLEAGLGAES